MTNNFPELKDGYVVYATHPENGTCIFSVINDCNDELVCCSKELSFPAECIGIDLYYGGYKITEVYGRGTSYCGYALRNDKSGRKLLWKRDEKIEKSTEKKPYDGLSYNEAKAKFVKDCRDGEVPLTEDELGSLADLVSLLAIMNALGKVIESNDKSNDNL